MLYFISFLAWVANTWKIGKQIHGKVLFGPPCCYFPLLCARAIRLYAIKTAWALPKSALVAFSFLLHSDLTFSLIAEQRFKKDVLT